jgi:hypothetical protein
LPAYWEAQTVPAQPTDPVLSDPGGPTRVRLLSDGFGPAGEFGCEPYRGVELDQVAGVVDEGEGGTGHGRVEAECMVDRDPGVVGPPDDVHGFVDVAVPLLDFVGEPLVGRLDLPVQRRLAEFTGPGFDEGVEVTFREPLEGSAADISLDGAAVDGRRELLEDVGVFAHEAVER